jgi:hypothetical protein
MLEHGSSYSTPSRGEAANTTKTGAYELVIIKEEAVNKNHLTAAGLAFAIALAPGAAKAVELLSKDDLSLDLGGRFLSVGELENTSNNQDSPWYYTGKYSAAPSTAGGQTITAPSGTRDNTRIYLFQTENRLTLNGNLDGTKVYFEEALGGEAVSTSNNQANLYQFFADVPVNDNFSVVVGQFKVPSNNASAIDDGSLLFGEKSFLFQDFFNQGYDMGVGLKSQGKGWDATLGVISGCPDLPQRYLPEIFNVPPLTYVRLGIGSITDDPYHQVQAAQVADSQWGVHLNGQYINNANAGHSTDNALDNTNATTVSSDTIFGNALLWTNWNPYLGKTSVVLNGADSGTAPVNENYWNTSLDATYRGAVAQGKTLILSAQGSFAEYNNNNEFAYAADNWQSRATINVAGGELVAALNADKWALGARLDAVLPDSNLMYVDSVTGYSANPGGTSNAAGKTWTTNTSDHVNPITGSKAIYDLTFPAITVRLSKYVHVTAETEFYLNSPEISGDDGVYELIEQPTQVTNLFAANTTHTNPIVCIGHMAFTVAF